MEQHDQQNSSKPRFVLRVAKQVLRDEQGGEVLEYALIAGLVVVGSITLIAKVGTKVLSRWTSLNSSM